MEYIHIRNLDKFNPGYADRTLIWCKIYFTMLNSNYEFDMIDDIDKWRFIALVMLELQMKKPIPYDEKWLQSKITSHKRPISLSIKMLHNFIELVTVEGNLPSPRVEKSRVEKSTEDTKKTFLEFVLLTQKENKALVDKLGQTKTDEYIKSLNQYIGSKGTKYKSHYHTICMWVDKETKPKTGFRKP